MAPNQPSIDAVSTEKPYFFSFIIPAHNEENYIKRTLDHIRGLEYPKENFEVLVIENGSTDRTFKFAKHYDNGNITTLCAPDKGVSKAKNFGLTKISPRSEWVIFLDADTIIEKTFLFELNRFLHKNERKNLSIGTTSVKPLENKDWYARVWMWIYDLGHRLTKTSYAIQIMKTEMKDYARFDPTLALAEDLKLIRDLLRFGNFFYFDTDTVLTSTRRFDKIGWVTLFIQWNWDALVWKFNKVKKEYPVIR